MRVIISGKNFSLTPSLKEYTEKKVLKLMKFSPSIEQARIELDVDHNQRSGNINRVEIWLLLQKKTLQIGIKANDMRAAIDQAIDKLEIQLVRLKEKRQAKIRRAPRLTDVLRRD